MNKRQKTMLIFSFIIFFCLFTPAVQASVPSQNSPVVHALFFYSPTCGHCHKVITEDLPPLVEKYGEQLQIMGINVATPEGQNLYQTFLKSWNIPDNMRGVPTLVVGDTYLVGSGDIPAQFPGIVASGLENGGIDWPDIPGLKDIIFQIENPDRNPSEEDAGENPDSTSSVAVDESNEITLADRFKQDLSGNILAVITLVGMIISVVWILISLLTPNVAEPKDFSWIIPVLSLVGLFVAGYLSFVEVTESEAVCGPIGDCNSVQQSPYAILFGFLPVGILGLLGYVAILAAWLLRRYGPEKWYDFLTLSIWGMALFGVLFSIYLTYLEPFVIGATCAWCISSAIIITIQLWAATGPVRKIWADTEDELDHDQVIVPPH